MSFSGFLSAIGICLALLLRRLRRGLLFAVLVWVSFLGSLIGVAPCLVFEVFRVDLVSAADAIASLSRWGA